MKNLIDNNATKVVVACSEGKDAAFGIVLERLRMMVNTGASGEMRLKLSNGRIGEFSTLVVEKLK